MSTHIKKLAPVLSNLLTKHILGTLYLSACLQTVSDWGSTPATPSNTATAPSKTFRDRSTSIVKSTCPGVSIIFILWSFQKMLWQRSDSYTSSCSCSIQSIVAAPSRTSPIYVICLYSINPSVVVVLPASMCAIYQCFCILIMASSHIFLPSEMRMLYLHLPFYEFLLFSLLHFLYY